MPAEGFALYVHLPWCRHVCPYCDFNVYASSAPPEREYTAALAAELAARVAAPPWQGRPIQSVYVGGGTPSLFSPAAIACLLDDARRRSGLVTDLEVTLEANPGTVSVERLRGYRDAGVTRLSLGAQSFDDRHLHTLGRDHGPADIVAAVHAARAAGLTDVSLDLIFGVPGQSVADWEADLAAAIALEPTHVSAYGLTYEAGTPYYAWRKRGRLRPVDDDIEAAMAEVTAGALPDAGYLRYEISSWARPGFASRHNQSYWDGSDYLGLGAGAHSYSRLPAPGVRWANLRLPADYVAAVTAGGTAPATNEQLTEAQARGEFCFTGLRRTVGIDEEGFRRRFGLELTAAFPHVAGLVADGLIESIGGRVRLTARGLRFADSVSATFV
jgi:oxygen-independent coproporphyrinogen-3 oxidase